MLFVILPLGGGDGFNTFGLLETVRFVGEPCLSLILLAQHFLIGVRWDG